MTKNMAIHVFFGRRSRGRYAETGAIGEWTSPDTRSQKTWLSTCLLRSVQRHHARRSSWPPRGLRGSPKDGCPVLPLQEQPKRCLSS